MTVLLVGYLLPVVAVSAALCGHVGEAWPPGVWRRAWRRRRRRPSWARRPIRRKLLGS